MFPKPCFSSSSALHSSLSTLPSFEVGVKDVLFFVSFVTAMKAYTCGPVIAMELVANGVDSSSWRTILNGIIGEVVFNSSDSCNIFPAQIAGTKKVLTCFFPLYHSVAIFAGCICLSRQWINSAGYFLFQWRKFSHFSARSRGRLYLVPCKASRLTIWQSWQPYFGYFNCRLRNCRNRNVPLRPNDSQRVFGCVQGRN